MTCAISELIYPWEDDPWEDDEYYQALLKIAQPSCFRTKKSEYFRWLKAWPFPSRWSGHIDSWTRRPYIDSFDNWTLRHFWGSAFIFRWEQKWDIQKHGSPFPFSDEGNKLLDYKTFLWKELNRKDIDVETFNALCLRHRIAARGLDYQRCLSNLHNALLLHYGAEIQRRTLCKVWDDSALASVWKWAPKSFCAYFQHILTIDSLLWHHLFIAACKFFQHHCEDPPPYIESDFPLFSPRGPPCLPLEVWRYSSSATHTDEPPCTSQCHR